MNTQCDKGAITIPYKKEYTNVLTSFIQEVGLVHGANEVECMQLSLLGEEVFQFILTGIPKYEFDEQFTLTCIVEESGLLLNFTNHGEPLYGRNIDEDQPYVPSEDVNAIAIGLEIIKKLSDRCEWVNNGREGWNVLVFKNINSFKELSHQNNQELERLCKEASSEILTVTRANGSHAAAIISLMYKTYRYSYAKSMFYYEDKLREALDNGDIVSLVAINASGDVVGHNSALYDSKRLAEVGMFMVDPIYRLNRTLLLLMKKSKVLYYGDEFKETSLYNKCITTHVLSQRAAAMSKFVPTALKISIYPRASFIGINADGDKRESLVYSASIKGEHSATLYIPKTHRNMCCKMFERLMLNYSFSDMVTERNECESVELISVRKTGYVSIVVKGIGHDFYERLPRLYRDAMRMGAITLACEVSVLEPLPADFDQIMMSAGY
ncbi:MAG: hypothetical protein R3Y04_03365, partial [Rikenellaceae bacterium]